MHTLIVGGRQIGKSTLIRRVLGEIGMPVSGFETKKEDALADGENGSPVYIYPAGGPYVQGEENLTGVCRQRCLRICSEAFDRFAPRLQAAPKGSIVLMDEIGVMESSSEAFCQAIMQVLDGDVPVIAAVKYKSTPFLEAVRNHPKCRCFTITEENRDALYDEVLAYVKAQVSL